MTDEIEIEFHNLPFAFDDNDQIRCLKCHDAGWVVNNKTQSGLSWDVKRQLNPVKSGDLYALPSGWSRSGTYDRERLNEDVWKDMVNESWRQIRHLGKQRARYLGVFGGLSVFGIFLTVYQGGVLDVFKGIVFLGLSGYTIFHFILSKKMAKAYKHNMDHIDLLAAITPPGADAGSFAMLRSMEGMVWRGWRRIQLSGMIPYFYVLLTLFWLVLAILMFTDYTLQGLLHVGSSNSTVQMIQAQ